MPNDYKDICRSIEKLEKAISQLPRNFSNRSDTKDISKMLEKQLREFQKSNRFEIQKEIGNSKQFKLTLLLSAIGILISVIALFKQ